LQPRRFPATIGDTTMATPTVKDFTLPATGGGTF